MLYHILSYEKTDLLKIDNIGFSDDPRICRFGPGQRELYLIHYVLSGKGCFNGTLLKKGDGFLITPHMREQYFPCEEEPWKLMWVTSRDERIEELFRNYQADPQTLTFHYNYVSVASAMTQAIKVRHNTVYSASELLEAFLHLFNHQKKQQAYQNTTDLYYDYALQHIHSNLFRSIKVSELVDLLGISQPYLYKIFKAKCGLSPKEKIDEMRLARAKDLLSSPDLSTADVAYSLGYQAPQDFYRFFKDKTNMSPTAYRFDRTR